MEDRHDDFEAVRREMTDRLIKALRHHVKGTPFPGGPSLVEAATLARLGLVEGGDRPAATDKGRAWLEWYEGRT